MLPRSPLRAGESRKDRAPQKERISKHNKQREITVKDKAYYTELEHVCIQRMSTKAAELSRSHHATH